MFKNGTWLVIIFLGVMFSQVFLGSLNLGHGSTRIYVYVIYALVWLLYVLPTIIAGDRNHNKFSLILMLNLFLGWTIVVWVLCLGWAIIGGTKK